jgi:hypothetical protein
VSDRLSVFPSRNPQGTLLDIVVEIQKEKFAVHVVNKCSPHGSGGGTHFMNCSWIIRLVHEQFMNMFKLLLRIFGYFQTVEKKEIIWIEITGENTK